MQILIQLFHILVFPGLLFDVAMGVLLMGLNNKLVARMQNRVGPPILQPWYDFLKCCGKETIVPARAKRAVFLGAPFLGFVLLISVSMFIPFAGFVPAAMGSDLVVILYLLTFVSVCEILGAASSGSPFAGVGLSREMVAMISYELPFVLVILTVARAAGADQPSGAVFSLEGVLAFQEMNGPLLFSPAIIPAAIAMLFVIPCETGMHPFDIAEAETTACHVPADTHGEGLYHVLPVCRHVPGKPLHRHCSGGYSDRHSALHCGDVYLYCAAARHLREA